MLRPLIRLILIIFGAAADKRERRHAQEHEEFRMQKNVKDQERLNSFNAALDAFRQLKSLLWLISANTSGKTDAEVQEKILTPFRNAILPESFFQAPVMFQEQRLILPETAMQMNALFAKIRAVPESIWNVAQFRENDQWIAIRNDAYELLMTLNGQRK
jgi:hypothetical protein